MLIIVIFLCRIIKKINRNYDELVLGLILIICLFIFFLL